MIQKSYLFVVVFSLFFIVSCSLFTNEKQIEIPVGIETESLEAEQYTSCVEECSSCEDNCLNRIYYTKALQEQKDSVCASITSLSLQQDCQQSILAVEAVSELSKEKCMQLTEEAVQQTCLVHVVAEIAVQSSSVEKCQEAADVERCQNIFYKEMALLSKDATSCDLIAEEEQKSICHEIVASLLIK